MLLSLRVLPCLFEFAVLPSLAFLFFGGFAAQALDSHVVRGMSPWGGAAGTPPWAEGVGSWKWCVFIGRLPFLGGLKCFQVRFVGDI